MWVTWDPPLPDMQNGVIVDYILVVTRLNTDEEYEPHSGENTANALTVQGLHPFYTYAYSIAAVTIGIGPSSAAVALLMPQDGKLIRLSLSNCISFFCAYMYSVYS